MIIDFGSHKIGSGQPVFIIAEIGINHEGDVDSCKQMVREAAKAGADAIKLQTVDPDENYVKGHTSWDLFRSCQLTQEVTADIFELSRKLGVEAFTTSPDPLTLTWVDRLGVPGHKMSSGMITNDNIIRKSCEKFKPVLISTGLATTEQIDHAVSVALSTGNKNIALFHCVSQYPAPLENLNLATVAWMAERYHLPVGFSDHSNGIEAPMVATTMGAVMIEKHFTLDKSRESFDHRISLERREFKEMVDGIRLAEKMTFDEISKIVPKASVMVGNRERRLNQELQATALGNLRCLVARRPITAGEPFTFENVALKRPFADNRGLPPKSYDGLIGKVCLINMRTDDPIKEEHICGINIEGRA